MKYSQEQNINKEDKVYFISDGENIKIGFTKGSISSRAKQLNTGNKNKLMILGYVYRDMDKENYLHLLFGRDRIRSNGEWFRSSQKLIDYINDVNELENTYVELDQQTNKVEVYKAIDLV